MLLNTPSGVYDRTVADEAQFSGWYTGPEEGDKFWPRFRRQAEVWRNARPGGRCRRGLNQGGCSTSADLTSAAWGTDMCNQERHPIAQR